MPPVLVLNCFPHSQTALLTSIAATGAAANCPESPRDWTGPVAAANASEPSQPTHMMLDSSGRPIIVPKSECDFIAMEAGLMMNRVFVYAKTFFLARIHNKRGCITKVRAAALFL